MRIGGEVTAEALATAKCTIVNGNLHSMLCVVIADANNSETVGLEDIQEKPKLSTSGDRCAI